MAVRTIVFALFVAVCLVRPVAGQEPVVRAGFADVAALMMYRDDGGRGYRAKLATHELGTGSGAAAMLVSAALYFPDVAVQLRTAAPVRGLIVFLEPGQHSKPAAGDVRIRWRWAEADTVLSFPTRSSTRHGVVAYAAEVGASDLRFLALGQTVEVVLPDGRTAVLNGELLRRLELLTRIAHMTTDQRNELVAYTRDLDEAIRHGTGGAR